MLKKLLQYYQIFCNLSLDVIVGVWCCMISLPICFDVEMPKLWYIALPLLTWVVYLSDHLNDVFRKSDEYPTPRHRFIKKYFKAIVLLVIIVSGFVLFELLKQFNVLVFVSGIALMFMVMIHFILVRINPQKKSLVNNKEFAVASIYTTGIYFTPLLVSYLNGNNIAVLLICFLLFLILTFINLLTLSIIEIDYDKQMGNSSWVINISQIKAQKILYVLLATVFSVGFILIPFVDENKKLLLIFYLLIAFGHFIIYKFREKLTRYLIYRKIAEILFWLPGLVYIFVR